MECALYVGQHEVLAWESLENLFLKKVINLLCIAVRGPTDKTLHKVVTTHKVIPDQTVICTLICTQLILIPFVL